jgi:hypothetical protein
VDAGFPILLADGRGEPDDAGLGIQAFWLWHQTNLKRKLIT